MILNIKDYKMTFPHGETHIKLPDLPDDTIHIRVDWEDDSDTMLILQAVDVIKRTHKLGDLVIDYLPYARAREHFGCYSNPNFEEDF